MRKMTIAILSVCLVFLGAVEVLAAYPTGYTLEQTGTGFAALSPEQFLSPPTSVKMGTVVDTDRAAIVFNGGPQLNSINQLSYWTYTVGAGSFGQTTAWVAIYLDTRPNRTYSQWVTDYLASDPNVFYLQAEPYFATGNPVLNTWQKQDAFGASALKWVGLESPDYPHEAPPLAAYISGAAVNWPTPSYGIQQFASREYGTLYIVTVKIRMGSGGPWVNTLAYVDDVTISDYFDPFGEVSIPTLSNLGMIIFILLAGLGSVYYLRRRRRA